MFGAGTCCCAPPNNVAGAGRARAAWLCAVAAAKKILKLPEWHGLHPVIQLEGSRYLDIRNLKLYKTNHCVSTSPKCNALMLRKGLDSAGRAMKLALTARRDIWRGEEILWEYSTSMTFD